MGAMIISKVNIDEMVVIYTTIRFLRRLVRLLLSVRAHIPFRPHLMTTITPTISPFHQPQILNHQSTQTLTCHFFMFSWKSEIHFYLEFFIYFIN